MPYLSVIPSSKDVLCINVSTLIYPSPSVYLR